MKYFYLLICLIVLTGCGKEKEQKLQLPNVDSKSTTTETAVRDFDVYKYPLKPNEKISAVNDIVYSFKKGETVKVRWGSICHEGYSCSVFLPEDVARKVGEEVGYILSSDVGKNYIGSLDGIYYPAKYKENEDSNKLYANDWKTLCNKIDGYTVGFEDYIANDISGIVSNQFSKLVENGANIQSKGFKTVKKYETDDSIMCVMSAKVSGILNGSTITKEERIYINGIYVSGDNVLAHKPGSPYVPPYATVAP